MKTLNLFRRRKPSRIIVLVDRGSLTNEQRLLAYQCRRNYRRAHPTIRYDLPIFTVE